MVTHVAAHAVRLLCCRWLPRRLCWRVLHASVAMRRCSRCAAVVLQVAELAAVWVSHRHADHMAGLPGILAARSSSKTPLLVSYVTHQVVLLKQHSSLSSASHRL